MLLALVLQAAAPQMAVDAERAFNAAAQARGQWTAFREFAAPDATMFVPQPVKAQAWLKDRKDPPKPVEWWPAASYASCDGKVAVNTGSWQRPDGAVGYFTTVWTIQPGRGWKWAVDHGDDLARARTLPTAPATVRAVCTGKPTAAPALAYREGPSAGGASPDGTLAWHWHVSSSGARQLLAWMWDGSAMVPVIEDKVAAPTK